MIYFMMIPDDSLHFQAPWAPWAAASPKVTLNQVPKTPPSTSAAAPAPRHALQAVKGEARSKAKEMERNPGEAGEGWKKHGKTRVYEIEKSCGNK